MSQTDPFAGQWRDINSVLTDQPPTQPAAPTQLTDTQKTIVGAVTLGALLIAALGFIGSYSAVVDLATDKGFGNFAHAFPIAVDAGIAVLLALDLLLTWLRMPYPVLRHVAWALTGATIAFNAAASWGDAVAVGMHGTIPVLFVIVVEAARHAVGRIANITVDRHIETPSIKRWILSPVSTYRMWRRQHLWHLTSYTDVIAIEREALVYRAKLRSEYGRGWRRSAPVHKLLALKLARYGTPVHETLAQHAAELADAREPELPLYAEPGTANPNQTEPEPAAGSEAPQNHVPEPVREPQQVGAGSPSARNPEPAENQNPEPVRKANPEPRTTRTSNQVGDRAAKRTAQIDEVLNLMTELGYDAVTLPVVQNRTGMSKTTAHHRLKDARAQWNQDAA